MRELSNIVERAVVLDLSDEIAPEHLHVELEQIDGHPDIRIPEGYTLRELEKRYIIETLAAQKNNREAAAKHLGIDLSTLKNKLKEYNQL